jgi:multidrug efflux pump subunit AcrB
MISSVFIRRPRLAIVISIVISIAGVIALRALPVAQFPDTVPPQVQVSALYPGASAEAVEESVAQVIEAQVNGPRPKYAQTSPTASTRRWRCCRPKCSATA